MPNWVSNELILKGSRQELASVRKILANPRATSQDQRLLDFARLASMPREVIGHQPLKDCGVAYHAGGPLDWRCWRETNWGSCRNASRVSVEGSAEAGYLRYEFTTAWTPARPFIVQVWLAWPGLSIDFTFVVPAMLFAGRDRRLVGDDRWTQANARYDEALCRAVLGNSRLAACLDGGPNELGRPEETDEYPMPRR